MKTVEELLADRFKVIAPYPGIKTDDWKVGDILDRNWCKYENDDEDAGVIEWQLSDFPHLFQPLPWWVDRSVEDMPAYVKLKNMKDEIEVHKAGQWNERNGMPFVEGFGTMIVREMTPATREEYELFKQKDNP